MSRFVLALNRKWPGIFGGDEGDVVDIYASAMTDRFNIFHRIIYPRFFKKIKVETDNVDAVKGLKDFATIVYVTKNIGQLEYNFFNYLFIKEGLPIARFINKLSLWQWLPFKTLKQVALERARRFSTCGPLPHPVSSGYLGAMIEAGNTVFLQLKSTAIFNDLYWYQPEEDPLVALLVASERANKPVYIVPIHFMWDKRPEGSESVMVGLLPSFFARTVKFWRNYKNRALVKVSPPIKLEDATINYFTSKVPEKARLLRGDLLNILQQEKRVTTGPALKPRSWIINEMMEDASLQRTVYEVAREKQKEVEDVKTLAKRYASEIAAYANYNYIEAAYKIMKWVLKNIYDGIAVNAEGLALLKKAAAVAPVILVPNHRSHMDYLLLSTILYENNITIPHIAAGMNLAFWPMGHIFRRCGAFFIRRKFAGNVLYRETLKTYLKTLLKEGNCQEFFIEGGRSRTGKLLRPRTGLLSMLIEGIREGAARQAFFVPVSITYDQVIEEYKDEIKGAEKKAERTRDLLRLHKHLKKNYGRIFVRFGEPIRYEGGSEDLKESVWRMAKGITYAINKEVVVTPVAVVSAAVLANSRAGIEHESIIGAAEELIRYLRWKMTPPSPALASDTKLPLLEAVELFEKSKLLKRHDEFDPMCYEVDAEARVSLSYYKNSIVHYFVSVSCVASIILAKLKTGRTPPTIEQIKEYYILCKKLFAGEFTFSARLDIEEHIKRVLSYFERGSFGLKTLEIYKGLIGNYFESYLVALQAVKDISGIEEKALLRRLHKYGRHMLLLGKIRCHEALSTPVFANALQSFIWLGLLKVDTDQKGKKLYYWDPTEIDPEKLKQLLEELS